MANKECKYCKELCVECESEGLQCLNCKLSVHIKCLKRGAVPGGLIGDIFFEFTCSECSSSGTELFIRDKMPWLQAILLTLYHMQKRCSGVAKKEYFHWKTHISKFISDQWNTLFRKDFKRKKNWIGTISGTLSHYSPLFFKSGTEIFNEQGWWALSLPTLTPHCVVKLNAEMVLEKQRRKDLKMSISEMDMLKEILSYKPYFTENLLNMTDVTTSSEGYLWDSSTFESKFTVKEKKKTLLPVIRNRYNFAKSSTPKHKPPSVDFKQKKRSNSYIYQTLPEPKQSKLEIVNEVQDKPKVLTEFKKQGDCFYHFNTVMEDISLRSKLTLKEKLEGGLQADLIYSPYSHRFISPYIYRFTEMNPLWLQLMDEIKCKGNKEDNNWKLPARAPLDFVYIQPSHIPAINSLCNQFFWSGIDVSDVLEYPEFSCVVLYRKLVVAFALLTPDVNINESYLSFIFTRPNWRNSGIAKIMLYHLTQANAGRDLTLHVSKNSKALLLYNKFSFKIEHVVQDFYDKYMRDDTAESKHAYFCRLAR